MEAGYRLAALGMTTALGSGQEEVFNRLVSGKADCLTMRDDMIPGRKVPVGEVRSNLPDIPEEFSAYDSRNSRLLASAYQQIAAAVQRAVQSYGAERIAVVLGSSTSGIAESERAVVELHQKGLMPEWYRYSRQEIGTVAEFLAEYAGLQGPCFTISTACSSSTKAFSSARNLLEAGVCDAALVGGSDSLCRLTLNGFSSLGLLSEAASIPFSRNRSGIVIGEGAALFLMTREPGGIRLLGIGESSDAHHISAPDPEGRGAEASMRAALEDSELRAEDICYINLHGTGTQPNDLVEARAVRRIFPADIPCSSTKPLSGHLLGASGAAELAFCWLCLTRGERSALPLPAHFWDGARDEELPELAFVPPGFEAQAPERRLMLSNSFAFGGSNCSVLIGCGVRRDGTTGPGAAAPA